MELFDDGKVFNKSDRFIMEPDAIEKIGAVVGFSSKRYTDYMRSKSKALEANAADGRENARSAAQINTLLDNGNDFEALAQLQEDAIRLNKNPKEIAKAVADLRNVQTFGPAAIEGRGPNAQRAGALYPSPLPQASDLTLKTNELSTLQRLQQMPMSWQSQLQSAGMMDTARSLMPGPRVNVRNALRDPGFKSTVLSTQQSGTLQQPGFGGLAELIQGSPY
jgi:hypothetical protein